MNTSASFGVQSIAIGSYSENASSDGAPQGRSDMAGDIKKLQVSQLTNGTLQVTIDYWALPSNHHILSLRWCTYISEFRHNVWTGENLTFLCDVSDPNWKNFVIYFEPALSSKGSQLGLRKSYKGTSRKGSNKNQRIYTLSGSIFRNSVIAGLDASMSYSSSTLEEVTTTCSGSYSITCNTSRSSIFDWDEVLIELNQVSQSPSSPKNPVNPAPSQPPASPQTPTAGGNTTIQSYFDRIDGQFNKSSRQFQVECINDAPRSGSVNGLKAFLAISSNQFGMAPGREWFPKNFTPEFVNRIKTWSNNNVTHLYIELDFTAKNGNPCGMIINNIPRLSEIGSDVNQSMFLIAGSTGYAVVGTNYSKLSFD